MNAADSGAPTLAPLTEGVLDASGLASLLRDVAQCTELVEIRVRAAAGRMASPAADAPSLDALEGLLRRREIVAAQLAYRFEGALWFDTLMTAGAPPEGVRIVRSGTPTRGGC